MKMLLFLLHVRLWKLCSIHHKKLITKKIQIKGILFLLCFCVMSSSFEEEKFFVLFGSLFSN